MKKIFENHPVIVNSLYDECLNSFFNKEEYLERLKYISDKFDEEIEDIPEHLHNKAFNKSILHKVFKVHERLLLIRDLKKQLLGETTGMEQVMYPGLITYLFLTCFDQLGQQDKGWRFFPNWLESKKCKDERNDFFEQAKTKEYIIIEENEINPKYIKEVYDLYHEIYGVKNSFFNFLRNTLPAEQRNNLLKIIIIEKYIFKDDKFVYEGLGDDKDKETWLFATRNNYTHSLITAETNHIKGYILEF